MSENDPGLKFYLENVEPQNFCSPRLGDAGFDLRAAAACKIDSGKQGLISTGLYLAIPVGWVGIIKDRSSIASKRIYTHGGVIDAGYRGEVKILLSNCADEVFNIEIGDKIAQMVVVPHLSNAYRVNSIDELGETQRGGSGFGSTGK